MRIATAMSTHGEIPAVEYVSDYYELHLRRYLLNDKWSRERIQDVMAILKAQPGERILDAGCGVGTISIEAAKRAAVVYGLDYSRDAIKCARELTKVIFGRDIIHFEIGSVMEIPLPDRYFQKVVSADLVEHLSERQVELFLNEAYRVLMENGRLIVYTPIIKTRPNIIHKLIGKIGGLPIFRTPGWEEPTWYPITAEHDLESTGQKYGHFHVNVMTAFSLPHKITNAGFKVADIRCSRSYSVLSKILPYPFNVLWGGHISVIASKKT